MNLPDLPECSTPAADPLAAATQAVILAYHQAWRRRDLNALIALYDPAVQYHDMLQNRLIAFAELREYLAASLPIGTQALQTYTDRLLVDGDTAVLQYRVTLEGSAGLVSFSAVETLTVRAGLIVKVNEYAVLINDSRPAPATRTGTVGRLGLSARQIGALAIDLQQYFQQHQAYLDPALDLPRVAHATGYTRNQISFFLNQVRGQTFYGLLNQLRLDHALAQLHRAPVVARIEEVALAAGFNSLSTFYRCFKQRTGVSPRAYLQGQH